MATNNNEFRIPLEGVDSEHCALIVDNGIAKLKGIESHRVELNNKEAIIETQNRETVSEAVNYSRFGLWSNYRKEIIPCITNDVCFLCG